MTLWPIKNSDEARWLLRSTLLAIFLAIVLTIVQQIAVQYEESSSGGKDFFFRFLWNYLNFSLLVLLFPRFVLSGWMLLVACFQTAVYYYVSYFDSPPGLLSLCERTEEGSEVMGAVIALFPWKIFCVFLGLAALQIAVQYWRDRKELAWKKRGVLALYCLLGLTSLFFSLNRGARALTNRAPYPTGPLVAKYGFTPVFGQELIYHWREKREGLLQAAVAREAEQSDLLNQEYFPEHLPQHIAIIQVESLDYAILGYRAQGKEVTPFLNSLRETSLHYRIEANHEHGSATADFVMLNGIPPARGALNYRIPAFPYNTSLARVFNENGYRTYSAHGVRGSFYSRRDAFEEMGIENIAFRQEILHTLADERSSFRQMFAEQQISVFKTAEWLPDSLVFDFGNWLLAENQHERNVLFLITASSHAPFDNAARHEIIAKPKNIQHHYFNSINCLDSDLERFYRNLSDDTLVIIYGDHTPGFKSGCYLSDIQNGKQYVPLIVALKGKDIHARQQTKDAAGASLSLRDVYSYLKRGVSSEPTVNRQEMLAKEPGGSVVR